VLNERDDSVNLIQYKSVGEIELQRTIVCDVAHLVTQIGDQFRAQKVSNTGDVLHRSHRVAEHLFDDVHVFGHQRTGIMQRVEFGGIAEIALDKVASRRVGWHVGNVERQ